MAADVIDILENAEFNVASQDDGTLRITVPYWRADIHIPEDIIEEVGRLSGFDEIEPRLPQRDFSATSPSDFDRLRQQLRRVLAQAGANEVLTYSFVHGDMLKKANQQTSDSYRITNSLSPDLQYYRQTLTPSLLSLVHPNVKQGFDEFGLFEINKTHPKPHGLTDEGVPAELYMLALTVTRVKSEGGAAYYQAKAFLEYLAHACSLSFSYQLIEREQEFAVTAPFEYRRSALVHDVASGEFIGIIGEYKRSVQRNFKLPGYTAGFEIDPEALLRAIKVSASSYKPLSRYPSVQRDICFNVPLTVTYDDVVSLSSQVLTDSDLETAITPIDLYQKEDSDSKNITLRIRLTAHNRTLTSADATNVIERVNEAVCSKTGAKVV